MGIVPTQDVCARAFKAIFFQDLNDLRGIPTVWIREDVGVGIDSIADGVLGFGDFDFSVIKGDIREVRMGDRMWLD